MPTVLERLSVYGPNGVIDPVEVPQVQCAIADLREKGWTDNEIVSYLRWMEHVDPDMDEDTALRNMKRVKDQVTERQANAWQLSTSRLSVSNSSKH